MNPRALALQRRLEAPLLLAALLTIPALAIEESGAGSVLDAVAVVLNWVVWLAFVAEAVLMLRVVDSKGAWLRSHPLEVVIVLLTPPLLPAALQAVRVFRLLRVLRLLRGALLARRLSTEGVRDAAVFALLTVLGGGIAYSAIETSSQDGKGALSAWDGVWRG